MLDKRIKFDESYVSEEHSTITLYFTAPKDLFDNIDKDVESVEISIECPREYISADYATVEYSPTKDVEEDGCYLDYDLREISLPYEEIEAFIKLAEESERM